MLPHKPSSSSPVVCIDYGRAARLKCSHNPQARAKKQHRDARITELFHHHGLSIEKIVRREKVGSLYVQSVIRDNPRRVESSRKAA